MDQEVPLHEEAERYRNLFAHLASLPNWSLKNGKLHREYKFPDFAHAFGFMATAAPLIEKADIIPNGPTSITASRWT